MATRREINMEITVSPSFAAADEEDRRYYWALSPAWKSCGGRTMDLELPKDFFDFLRLLHESSTEYLLIGGYAVSCGASVASLDRRVPAPMLP